MAAETVSPFRFSTGMLSPVRADSFTALSPSKTIPSTGILSPGRTTNLSPSFTFSMETISSFPSLRITAVFGASFISDFNALVVFPFEKDSRVLPTVIKVRIVADDSK